MLDNISDLSEHTVNTERVKTADRGMYHKEGGLFIFTFQAPLKNTSKIYFY